MIQSNMYLQYSDKIHWIGIGLNIHIKASFLTNVIVRFSVCPLDQCKPSVFDSQSFCANDIMSGGIYSTYKHDVNKINYRFIMSVSERSWLIGQAITVMSQSCSVHTVQFPLPSHTQTFTHTVFIILVPSAWYSSIFYHPCFLSYILSP